MQQYKQSHGAVATYNGETDRNLNTRITEDKRILNNNNNDNNNNNNSNNNNNNNRELKQGRRQGRRQKTMT